MAPSLRPASVRGLPCLDHITGRSGGWKARALDFGRRPTEIVACDGGGGAPCAVARPTSDGRH